MALSQGVDDYDDAWLHEPFCIKILCEYDKVRSSHTQSGLFMHIVNVF